MKRPILLLVLLSTVLTLKAQQVDPYHTATGGFGYPVASSPEANLWWAEGTYKIMMDMPAPKGKARAVSVAAAKNEWESFQIVVNPTRELSKVEVALSDLKSGKGSIPASAFTVRKVEYVQVKHPTDSYGKVGFWPDPLPAYRTAENLAPGRNHPFWITVKVPKDAVPGIYKGTVTLSSKDGWSESVPLSLEVWDFVLPDSPTMRSGFGFSIDRAALYDNLTTPEQIRKEFDIYMKAFSDHKMSPYDPFVLTPIKETVSGIPWEGGVYDPEKPHGGRYSYKIIDASYTSTPEASPLERIKVEGGKPHTLKWWSRAEKDDQTFVVGVQCYGADGELLPFENRYNGFTGGKDWKEFSYNLGTLPAEAAQVSVHLYPSNRVASGNDLGTVWFDDVALSQGDSGKNLLPEGDFEVDPDKVDITLDFSDFIPAARKYFGEYGFTGYRMRTKGLGSGTFYSRKPGEFASFVQGTEEYGRLMRRYLRQLQDGLEEAGILGKEYIYWFDEPGDKDYDFVRETNSMIKEYAPKLTTFLTEHISGHDISDVTDITCSIWHKIDHDAINMRMWSWGSYVHHLNGLLIWETTYWNSAEASPDGMLQNPWEEAMGWTTGYGTIKGKQAPWGNGDGRLFYPDNRHVGTDKTPHLGEAVPSFRVELLRDGIEDFEYFTILERLAKEKPSKAAAARRLLQIPASIYTDEQHYSKDPQSILHYRRRIAAAIQKLQ